MRTFPCFITMIAALAGSAGPAAAATPQHEVHAVVFIDLIPDEQPAGSAVLAGYVRQARADPAMRSVLLVEQDSIPNHYILEETFTSRAAYERFSRQDYVRTFRTALFPHLGSPWDERLGTAPPP